jgi:hypothetical protein
MLDFIILKNWNPQVYLGVKLELKLKFLKKKTWIKV